MKKYFVTGTVCLLVLFFVGFMMLGSVQAMRDTQEKNNAEIIDLQNRLAVSQKQTTDDTTTVISEETGSDSERIAADSRMAEQFMRTVFSWETDDEYRSARETIMKDYSLTEDSSFMKEFMPDMTVTSRDGTEYLPIDILKLNASFDKIDVRFVNVAGDTYSYFCTVKWYVRGSFGTSESTDSMFLFDTDAEGNIKNLEAYTLV